MVEFVTIDEARARSGLRVVMVGGVPSPWGEAAKGILYVKQVPYVATRMTPDPAAVQEWTGENSAPIAVLDDEAPRTGWDEILLLAERLVPEPTLLGANASERALVFGLGHEICGEDGLGWARRIAGVHLSLTTGEGFPKPVAEYLGQKYGYTGHNGEQSRRRVIELLEMFSERLESQADRGSRYLVGGRLTAADIWLATCLAIIRPLPPEHCPMPDAFRAAFEAGDPETDAALDPRLLEHRDRIYAEHLELPLEL